MTRSEKRRPGSARVVIVFPGAIELASGGEGAGAVKDHGRVGAIFRSVLGHGRVQALPALIALFLWHPRNRRSFTTSIDSPRPGSVGAGVRTRCNHQSPAVDLEQ